MLINKTKLPQWHWGGQGLWGRHVAAICDIIRHVIRIIRILMQLLVESYHPSGLQSFNPFRVFWNFFFYKSFIAKIIQPIQG